MSSVNSKFDFWYAVQNTKIVRAPSRALETFGVTRINYTHLAELPDVPGKIRIREGRLEANKPALITPEAYVEQNLEGFGDAARAYLSFLKEHEDSVRILRYGYNLSRESFSEQVVTDSMEAVTERVTASAVLRQDPFAAVVRGVDEPWDVSLIHLFWLHVNASAPVNVREFEKVAAETAAEGMPKDVRAEVECAFERASADPRLVNELGQLLQRRGVFDRYQDRFFKLLRLKG